MDQIKKKDKLNYYKFLNSLPRKINKLYFHKLKGKFKLNNKYYEKRNVIIKVNVEKKITWDIVVIKTKEKKKNGNSQ